MSNIEAIKTFFSMASGSLRFPAREVTNRELMDLTKEERAELGVLCIEALK